MNSALQDAAKEMKSYVSGQETQDKDSGEKKPKAQKIQKQKASQPLVDEEAPESSGCEDVPGPEEILGAEGEEEEEEAEEADPEMGFLDSDQEDGDLWKGHFASNDGCASQKKKAPVEHQRWPNLPERTARLVKKLEPSLLGSLPVSVSRPGCLNALRYEFSIILALLPGMISTTLCKSWFTRTSARSRMPETVFSPFQVPCVVNKIHVIGMHVGFLLQVPSPRS